VRASSLREKLPSIIVNMVVTSRTAKPVGALGRANK